jgi:hypothetical protein
MHMVISAEPKLAVSVTLSTDKVNFFFFCFIAAPRFWRNRLTLKNRKSNSPRFLCQTLDIRTLKLWFVYRLRHTAFPGRKALSVRKRPRVPAAYAVSLDTMKL